MVNVCQIKDIVCGDRPANWCAECPKRAPAEALPLPAGWKLERRDKKPFLSIEITAPNGYATCAYSHGRNPENILYMLADALLAAAPAAPVQAARWIPVDESSPEPWECVLIASHEGVEYAQFAYYSPDVDDYRSGFMVEALHDMIEERSGVTHWWRLPPAPDAPGQERG